jgi:hypothetical protein
MRKLDRRKTKTCMSEYNDKKKIDAQQIYQPHLYDNPKILVTIETPYNFFIAQFNLVQPMMGSAHAIQCIYNEISGIPTYST